MLTANDNAPKDDAARVLPILGRTTEDGRIDWAPQFPGTVDLRRPGAHPNDPREA